MLFSISTDPPTWDKVVLVDVLLVVWRQRQFKITRSCQLDTSWQDTWRSGAQPLALALVPQAEYDSLQGQSISLQRSSILVFVGLERLRDPRNTEQQQS